MPKTTLSGEPLSENAIQNLERFRQLLKTRIAKEEKEEAQDRRLNRAGVKQFSDEEKAAFLASRPDLQ